MGTGGDEKQHSGDEQDQPVELDPGIAPADERQQQAEPRGDFEQEQRE
jgi:hypothetical protein